MTELQTILARLDRLETENAMLRQEVTELRASAPVPPTGAAPAEAAGPVSRRALLGAGLGAVAATVAATVARPSSVSANDPNDVRLGADNVNVTSRTLIATTPASNADAIIGVSYAGASGIVGQSTEGTGVLGYAGTGAPPPPANRAGVAGIGPRHNRGTGVSAEAGGDGIRSRGGIAGVQAEGGFFGVTGFASGSDGIGVRGHGVAVGVMGWCPDGIGMDSFSQFGTGVRGVSVRGVGVIGESQEARGGVFKSKVAQLRLAPAAAANHPATGARGDLFVDKSGRLWYCKGTTTWVQLA